MSLLLQIEPESSAVLLELPVLVEGGSLPLSEVHIRASSGPETLNPKP